MWKPPWFGELWRKGPQGVTGPHEAPSCPSLPTCPPLPHLPCSVQVVLHHQTDPVRSPQSVAHSQFPVFPPTAHTLPPRMGLPALRPPLRPPCDLPVPRPSSPGTGVAPGGWSPAALCVEPGHAHLASPRVWPGFLPAASTVLLGDSWMENLSVLFYLHLSGYEYA